MLQLFILQNLYNLSDEGTIVEVIDSRAFSEFYGVCKIAPEKYYTFGSNYYLGYQGIKEGMCLSETCEFTFLDGIYQEGNHHEEDDKEV